MYQAKAAGKQRYELFDLDGRRAPVGGEIAEPRTDDADDVGATRQVLECGGMSRVADDAEVERVTFREYSLRVGRHDDGYGETLGELAKLARR